MKVNIKALVQLLDGHESKWSGHITSVIGLVGEDINATVFVDFLKRIKGVKAEVLPDIVTPGQQKGQRLDRWIQTRSTLYQSEIKNWCSFQIGGYQLSSDATKQEVEKLANKNWMRELKEHYKNPKVFGKVSKVLTKMKIPNHLLKYHSKIEPLVIHWMPISNSRATPFFSVPVKSLGLNKYLLSKTQFDKVYYFSSSLYLRELLKSGVTKLDMNLPNVKTRLTALKTFLNL